MLILHTFSVHNYSYAYDISLANYYFDDDVESKSKIGIWFFVFFSFWSKPNQKKKTFRQMTSICFVCNLPIMSHQVGLVWTGKPFFIGFLLLAAAAAVFFFSAQTLN